MVWDQCIQSALRKIRRFIVLAVTAMEVYWGIKFHLIKVFRSVIIIALNQKCLL